MTADTVPLRRVLLRAGPTTDLSAAIAHWRRLEPAPLLAAGARVPSPAGPVEVISCHPTRSGRLHRDTRLLAGPPLPPPPASARAATLARVAGFVARLLVPAAPPPLLLAFVCLWALRRRRTAPRRLSAVSDAELQRRARGVAVSDTQSTVVVSSGALRWLGAAPGQWWRCELRTPVAGTRQVGLQLVSGDVPTDTALISSTLWWNLALHPDRSAEGEFTDATLLPLTPERPPVARVARLAQLSSPAQLPLEECSAVLAAHFSRPRLLMPGQVLRTGGRPGEKSAWFVVQSVELETPHGVADGGTDGSAGVLACADRTSVYQVSDVVGRVPPAAPVTDTPWESGMLPAGLESELRQLCLLLAPGGAPRPLVSLCGEPGSGLDRLVAVAASRLGLHLVPVDGPALLADSSGATASRVHQALSSASLGPGLCLVHLRDAHVLGRDRESSGPDARVVAALLEAAANLPDSAALLLSAPSGDQLVHQLRAHVTHEVTLSAPDAEKRARMLRWLCRRHGVALDWMSDRQVALQTAGYLLGDLEAVVTQAKCSALARLDEWCSKCGVSPPVRPPPLSLDSQDIQAGLGFVRARQAEVAGSPQIPDTRWQDVGGLGQVKREVVDLIQLPLARPELFAGAAARSGILLYGPPGTGKTLVAKAVATECRLNFLSVKGPELINMYVGQSEANVRDVFRRARDAAPAVVFFDELDSLAPNRGRTGDSGGVMDRVVSQFLSELDGAVTGGQVYVIGATNRPDLIDPALLRPGRFDRLLYLGASRDRDSHTAILRAQTRRLPLAGDVSLEEVVSRLPEALTGADVYALCEQATRAALDRAVLSVEAGAAAEDSVPIEVRQSDLLSAADSLAPSLSPAQLAEYELLRTRIEGN
ncbi:peroxisome assembly factor 2-like isoform X2 [Amphibalanus amphitrite]|uniref:peroxisome assembly factor 2-like isoform X2 n=1 Tax=Amphibalanus amphitrite TaxID=1232801 RepID=UPI001C919778|nr:peroxisome assembly factor 2-like isoform X2 [Amphibalanus amphitrite]XP_043226224.1 peroxisome assembly factor 2-like isoform X2 [Amphibalanus amphitrite]